MRVDVLEGILARVAPRFLYTVPTFHNPTGRTLSLDRRRKLLALSEKYGVPIVEDDAYRHLHLEKEAPPALKALDMTGNVIYLNTFSKMLFPGLRIGWIAGSKPIIDLVARMKELSISTHIPGQVALASFLRDDALRPHLAASRELYAEHARLMESQLDALRPMGIGYEKPEGGFYFWISLPETIQARKLMLACRQAGVAFASGDMFLLREVEQPYIRLCYAHEGVAEIKAGMAILSETIRKQLEGS